MNEKVKSIVAGSAMIFVMLLALGLLFSLLLSLPLMLLWNWLMPVIFGLPTIGFWQAFGLCILTRILIPTSTVKSKK